MDLALLLSFWGLSALLACTPGVDWAYPISAGLQRRAVPAVLGMLAGHLTAAVAVTAGLAAIIASSGWILTAISCAGGLYLLWLGVRALLSLRRRHDSTAWDTHATPVPTRRAAFLQGAGVSLLNPKVFLLFLALLPQFASPSASLPIGGQMLVLGLVHVATCAVVYVAVACGAGAVLSTRPLAAAVVTGASGVVMAALGAGVVVDAIVGP